MTPDPAALATRLFGPDPDELPGRWTTDYCGAFRDCPRCWGCLGIGEWRFDPRLPRPAATRPAGGGSP